MAGGLLVCAGYLLARQGLELAILVVPLAWVMVQAGFVLDRAAAVAGGASRGHPKKRASNAFVRLLLRSPAHGLLSSALILLRVPGTPEPGALRVPRHVRQEDGSLWVVCGQAKDKTWWRNLVDPSPSASACGAKSTPRRPHAIVGEQNPQAAFKGLSVWVRRFPRAGRRLGVNIVPDGSPDAAASAKPPPAASWWSCGLRAETDQPKGGAGPSWRSSASRARLPTSCSRPFLVTCGWNTIHSDTRRANSARWTLPTRCS